MNEEERELQRAILESMLEAPSPRNIQTAAPDSPFSGLRDEELLEIALSVSLSEETERLEREKAIESERKRGKWVEQEPERAEIPSPFRTTNHFAFPYSENLNDFVEGTAEEVEEIQKPHREPERDSRNRNPKGLSKKNSYCDDSESGDDDDNDDEECERKKHKKRRGNPFNSQPRILPPFPVDTTSNSWSQRTITESLCTPTYDRQDQEKLGSFWDNSSSQQSNRGVDHYFTHSMHNQHSDYSQDDMEDRFDSFEPRNIRQSDETSVLERVERSIMREEQDQEYQNALNADAELTKKMEEEEHLRKKKEADDQTQRLRNDLRSSLQADLSKLYSKDGNKPGIPGCPFSRGEVIRVCTRLPASGKRLVRHFPRLEPFSAVKKWLDCELSADEPSSSDWLDPDQYHLFNQTNNTLVLPDLYPRLISDLNLPPDLVFLIQEK